MPVVDDGRICQAALAKKHPEAAKISWEKEKGNYEANSGGKSEEDNSLMFTPVGTFVDIVKAIPVTDLPAAVAPYVAAHSQGGKIKEVGKVRYATEKSATKPR